MQKAVNNTTSSILGRIAVIALAIVFVAPLLWMVLSSLKTEAQLGAYPPQWLPWPIYFKNYAAIWSVVPFLMFIKNSLIVSVASVVGTLVSCPMAAYGFSHLNWKGRDALFFLCIFTMMIPFQVTMVPLFIMFSKLGMNNTFIPLFIESFFGIPFFIFLLRQFFNTIPTELADAARIDGCNEWHILFRLFIPLAKPALLVICLFQFMWAWNDFIKAYIYIKDVNLYTLSLGLSYFNDLHGRQWGLMMTGATVAVLPIVVIFLFVQRSFLEGITMTGLKG